MSISGRASGGVFIVLKVHCGRSQPVWLDLCRSVAEDSLPPLGAGWPLRRNIYRYALTEGTRSAQQRHLEADAKRPPQYIGRPSVAVKDFIRKAFNVYVP